MKLLVSVGTTRFPLLTAKLDTAEAADALAAAGVERVWLQAGQGEFDLSNLAARIPVERVTPVEYFARVDAADVILCHCGAGTVLDALRRRKPMVVVVNETLKGNHQKELFEALLEGGMAVGFSSAAELDLHQLKRYLIDSKPPQLPARGATSNLFDALCAE